MKVEEVFAIVKQKRLAVVSTADESGAPEAALVGFALTERNEVVFDTLGSSRKAVNIARRATTALVIGWDNDITVQIEGYTIRVGSKRFMEMEGIDLPQEVVEALDEAHREGYTMVMVGVNDRLGGAIELCCLALIFIGAGRPPDIRAAPPTPGEHGRPEERRARPSE